MSSTADSWTHVSHANNRSAGAAPTLSAAGTRSLSIASMPPRAPSSRILQTGPPPPKSAARPAASAPKAVDIRSMSEFPSLGGNPTAAAPAAQRPNAISWSSTVADMAVREAPTVTVATPQTHPRGSIDADMAFLRSRYRLPDATATTRRSRLANIGTRCFDDGPVDYTGPEEFDDDGAGSYHEEDHRVSTPTATEGELNADLAVSRRAGDKSDW